MSSFILVPFALPLQPALPTIEGNVDYQKFRRQLQRIDELLIQSGLEQQFLQQYVQQWLQRAEFSRRPPSAKAQRNYQVHTRRALRCNLTRTLLGEGFRSFSTRLADSPLLQWFCGLAELDRIRVPSKSLLQRYAQWADLSQVQQAIELLLQQGQSQPCVLHLDQALDLEAYFLDTTCVKANIHYPVDWVLLRDATRTLMKSVRLIRNQGLKHRMEEPEVFLSRMNTLCIQMTQSGNRSDSKRQRKRILRVMDRLVGNVAGHARRYRDLLEQQWSQTQWTRPQAEVVLRRLDQVLEQLPAARQQARQRILQGQLVDTADKILSLYEPDVNVIVRRKAGAEVEFGNTLLLGESRQGLIVDWKLFQDSAPHDSKLVLPSLERIQPVLGGAIHEVGGDRGFDSASNREGLEIADLYNSICPKDPKALKRRMKSWKFVRGQRRRAQTEARIAILKNNFLGCPLRPKGFAHRELAVGWAVLTHNLWVIARLPQRQARKKPTPLAQAA